MSSYNKDLAVQKQTYFSRSKKALAGAGAFLATNYALAAVDVAPLKTEIDSNGASIQTIGLAILALVALIVGIMMIRRVMR